MLHRYYDVIIFYCRCVLSCCDVFFVQGLPHIGFTFKNAFAVLLPMQFMANGQCYFPNLAYSPKKKQPPNKNNNNDLDLLFGYQVSAQKDLFFFGRHKFHTPEDSGKQLGHRCSLSKRLFKIKTHSPGTCRAGFSRVKFIPPTTSKGKKPGEKFLRSRLDKLPEVFGHDLSV